MHHIATAIRHLGSTSGPNTGLATANVAGTGLGGGNLPQGESDQILNNAIVTLQPDAGIAGERVERRRASSQRAHVDHRGDP